MSDSSNTSLWGTFVDAPDSTQGTVGGSLALFGVVVGLVGVGLFAFEQTVLQTDFTVRGLAAVLGALGLILFSYGIALLRSGGRIQLLVSTLGATVSFVSIQFFWTVYPSHFNVTTAPDYALEVSLLYAAGIVVIVTGWLLSGVLGRFVES